MMSWFPQAFPFPGLTECGSEPIYNGTLANMRGNPEEEKSIRKNLTKKKWENYDLFTYWLCFRCLMILI